MKKLSSLRRHLLDAVPELAANPERLLTFVDNGSIAFHRGTNYDHRYQYTARLILTDYRGETDAVIVPLLYWLSIYEPDIDPERAVAFEAEILDNETCDLDLTVQIEERVRARLADDTGRIEARHIATRYDLALIEPPPSFQVYAANHATDGDYRLVAEWPVPTDGE